MEISKDKQQWLDEIRKISKGTLVSALGIEFIDVDQDKIELEMPITDSVRQPYGLLHGGASMALAETAASAHAAWKIDLSKKFPVGIEINGSHMRSAKEGHVRAVGKVLRWSPRFVVHSVEIIHLESGRLLSNIRVTNYYKKIRAEASA